MKGLEMVNCESLRINMFRITHTGKSVNFPVTTSNRPHYAFAVLMSTWDEQNIWGLWIKLLKLHIFFTSRSEYLTIVKSNIYRCIFDIFWTSRAVWSVFSRNYFLLFKKIYEYIYKNIWKLHFASLRCQTACLELLLN